MKSDPFDVVTKYDGPAERQQQQADPTDGRIVAVLICSHILDADIWLAFDPDFKPDDDDEQLAVFYADEIPILKNKTPEQLKKIHETKLASGPGTRVRQ